MKSDKEIREFQSTLCNTQFYYSEVCLSFSRLIAKDWYKPEKTIIIPSVANDDEIRDLERKAEQIDIKIPSDDEIADVDSDSISQPPASKFTLQQRKKANGKRIPIPWSKQEINAIKEGLKKYGPSHWIKIKTLNQEVFEKNGRTSHDIADKYRSLMKRNDFKAFMKNL